MSIQKDRICSTPSRHVTRVQEKQKKIPIRDPFTTLVSKGVRTMKAAISLHVSHLDFQCISALEKFYLDTKPCFIFFLNDLGFLTSYSGPGSDIPVPIESYIFCQYYQKNHANETKEDHS